MFEQAKKILLSALVVMLASCGGGGSDATTQPGPTAIDITPASATHFWGRTVQMTSSVPTSSWSSSDPNVATVDRSGLVSLHNPGTASITATVNGVTSNVSAMKVLGFKPDTLWAYHSNLCALDEDSREMYCAGDRRTHTKAPLPKSYKNPVRLDRGAMGSGETIAEMALGELFDCARTTESVYCWGKFKLDDRNQNAMGTGGVEPVWSPQRVLQGEMPPGVKPLALRLLYQSACVIGSDSEIYCWGYRSYLPLTLTIGTSVNVVSATGYFSQPMRLARGEIPSTEVIVDLAMNSQRLCALTASGAVYCANNRVGAFVRLPAGDVPANVKLIKITPASDYSLNLNLMSALGDDGWVYNFGSSKGRYFGNGTDDDVTNANAMKRLSRGDIPDNVKLVDVSSAKAQSCALGDNGRIYCWGDSSRKTLPDGTIGFSLNLAPVAMPLGDAPESVRFTHLICPDSYCAAMGSDRKIYAWGGVQGGLNEPSFNFPIDKRWPTLINPALED